MRKLPPYGPRLFLLCWTGWDHTGGVVGLHGSRLRADDSDGNVSIVNTGGERWHEQREAAQEEEGRRRKKGQLVPRLVLVKDD